MRHPLHRILPLLAAAFFSHAAAADPAHPLILMVQGLPNEASTDPASVAEQQVVARFQQKHPGIQIQGSEGLRIQNMNVEATTMMMIAGGIAPDIIRMNLRSSDTYIQQGITAPLDSFIEEDREKGVDILGGVLPQFLPVVRKVGPEGTTHIYGLPTSTVVSGLYFNKELFRLAGLPPRAPRDWEELSEFASKIKALGPNHAGLYLPAGSSAAFHLMNLLRAAGGDAVVEIAPNTWRASFNTPEAVEAYTFYYRLVEGERSAIRPARAPTVDELRRIGMMFRYVGDTVAIDPEIWGFGPVPKGPRGDHGAEINAGILAMFSGIEDPAKRRAAWEYLKFVTGEEANQIRIQTLVDLGQSSILNPILLRRHGFEEQLVLTQPGLEEQLAESMATGKPEPYGRNCNLIYLEMTYPLDEILLSRKVREAWDRDDRQNLLREIGSILDRAVERTNERMVGHVDPEIMRFRRIVTAGVVAFIAAAFIWVIIQTGRSFLRSGRLGSKPVSSKSLIPWLCLLPAFGLLLVWEYIPLLRGAQLAFLDYKILLPSVFVGLDNFASVLFNAGFWRSILVTGYFAALKLTFGFAAPIILAYMLHLIPKQKILFRTLYYLPAVLSGTAVFFLWGALFDGEGVLNQMLRLAGFDATRPWTQDPALAMLTCVIPGIWASTGPGCLIYLAALKTIPEEQFEAAELDGAGFWGKTWHVVLPGLKALVAINFIGAFAAALQTSSNILIMTGGGPNGATEVAALMIFFEAFTRLNFGTATSMSWIIGSMMLGFTILQLQRLSRMEFKTAKA